MTAFSEDLLKDSARLLLIMAVLLSWPAVCNAGGSASSKKTEYKGWIHIYNRSDEFDSPLDGYDFSEYHYNNVTFEAATVFGSAGERQVEWISIKKGERMVYYAESNVLKVFSLSKKEEEWAKDSGSEYKEPPTTLKALQESNELKKDNFTREETEEGDGFLLYILDVEGYGERECIDCPDSPDTLKVWVDPETLLIRRIQNSGSQKGELIFEYGEPHFSGIFDLDVPEDAQMRDYRMSPRAENIVERINGRARKGLGDLTAMLLESTINGDQKPKPRSLIIFSRRGEAVLYYKYSLRNGDVDMEQIHGLNSGIKEAVDISSAVNALENVKPVYYCVTDSLTVWEGVFEKKFDSVASRSGESRYQFKEKGFPFPRTLAAKLWPAEQLQIFLDDGWNVETVNENESSDLIGLAFKEPVPEGREDETTKKSLHVEHIYKFDLKKDDLPVEIIDRSYSGEKIKTVFRTVSSTFENLPNGLFYPAYWETTAAFFSKGKQARKMKRTYHLIVDPDFKMVDEWFVSPSLK